jgi:flagellar protein FlaG
MSSDMLKVLSGMESPRLSQTPPSSKAQHLHAVDKGQPVAANGELLPQQETADTSVKVEQAVSQANQIVQSLNRDLHFMVDEDSGRTVIKVLDSETKEIIRQIPSEELLKIAATLTEGKSLLVKEQA